NSLRSYRQKTAINRCNNVSSRQNQNTNSPSQQSSAGSGEQQNQNQGNSAKTSPRGDEGVRPKGGDSGRTEGDKPEDEKDDGNIGSQSINSEKVEKTSTPEESENKKFKDKNKSEEELPSTPTFSGSGGRNF
ncbi:MAG: hypothetical protein LBC92_03060, partial [Rickettsiales bacterium]|nr:hypothetical protein [Rickettsiales bacterium]